MRYKSLDSLRGIACLMVLMAHIFALSYTPPEWYRNSLLYITYAAHEAVVFFFVLSGFVLTIPFIKNDQYKLTFSQYKHFLFKRVKRIAIPFLVAAFILFTLLFIKLTFFNQPQYSNKVLNTKWTEWPDLIELVLNFQIIIDFDTMQYNPIVWSLLHEMRFAFLFPIFLIMLKKYNFSLIFMITLGVTSTIFYQLDFLSSEGYLSGYTHFIHYSIAFFTGMLLCKYHTNIVKHLDSFGYIILFILGIILIVYSKSHILIIVNKLQEKYNIISLLINSYFIHDYFIMIGCSFIMIPVIHYKPLAYLFTFKPLYYIGRISYSIYLYHYTVLLFIFFMLNQKVNNFLIVTLSVSIIFIISYLSNKYIENHRINYKSKRQF